MAAVNLLLTESMTPQLMNATSPEEFRDNRFVCRMFPYGCPMASTMEDPGNKLVDGLKQLNLKHINY